MATGSQRHRTRPTSLGCGSPTQWQESLSASTTIGRMEALTTASARGVLDPYTKRQQRTTRCSRTLPSPSIWPRWPYRLVSETSSTLQGAWSPAQSRLPPSALQMCSSCGSRTPAQAAAVPTPFNKSVTKILASTMMMYQVFASIHY